MFCIGDYVVYADDGVCQVVDVGTPNIQSRYAARAAYYTLRPLFYKGAIYAPVDAPARIRPLITPEAARQLLERLPTLPGSASYASDQKQLSEYYRKTLQDNTCDSFAQTAKGIYEKYHAPGKKNRLPNSVEMQYFKRASDLLAQELSVALDEPMASIQRQIERVCGIGEG